MSLINKRWYKKSHSSLPVPGKRMAVHFRMYAGSVTHPVPKYHRDVRGKGRNEDCDKPNNLRPPQSIWNRTFLIPIERRILLNQKLVEVEGALVYSPLVTDEQTQFRRRYDWLKWWGSEERFRDMYGMGILGLFSVRVITKMYRISLQSHTELHNNNTNKKHPTNICALVVGG